MAFSGGDSLVCEVVGRFSAPYYESVYQRLRETRRPHAGLHLGYIVGHPPELNNTMLHIGDGESGTRITIARLADRTGI
jgi:hypothetical protein